MQPDRFRSGLSCAGLSCAGLFVTALSPRRIIFDGIDVLLTLRHNPMAEMRAIDCIRDWLADNDLSAMIT